MKPDKGFYKKLRVALMLMLGVVIFGTAGFMIIESLSVADAFYMTILIMSTVGLEVVQKISPEGRMFITGLIIVSFGIGTYAIAILTTYIIEGELHKYLKFRRVKNKIEKLENHIIVCGYGRNGKKACEELRSHGREFVVIETSPQILNRLHNRNDTLYLEGDATQDQVLAEAGITKASALITTLPEDADNVFVVLTARGLNENIKIISRASEDSSFNKLKRAGADNVIMPDKIGGIHMAALIAHPDVLEFVEVITGRATFDLEEISFRECKPEYVGKTLKDIHDISKTEVNILGMKTSDGNYLINPDLSTVIDSSTKLFVLGSTEEVVSLKKKLAK